MKPKSNIAIRLSRPGDAPEVLRLKDETWLDAYPSIDHGVSVADIESHLTKDDPAVRLERWQGYLAPTDAMQNWIALDDGKIVAFVAAAKAEPRNEVKALYVLPAYQRQGIGSALMSEALAWLGSTKDIFLGVVEYNQPAIAAYTKAGFVPNGRSKDDPFELQTGATMPVLEMVKAAAL